MHAGITLHVNIVALVAARRNEHIVSWFKSLEITAFVRLDARGEGSDEILLTFTSDGTGEADAKGRVPPLSGDPLHHFDAPQHAGPPLPPVAVVVEVISAGQEVELHHAEHPIAVLDKHTQPGERVEKAIQGTQSG